MPSTAFEAFSPAKRMFRCPICKGKMSLSPKRSLVCKHGHCFDLSARGYVNFLAGTAKSRYSADLFANRHTILQAGFYDPVLDALHESIARRFPQGRVCVLDAGCGDGFYAKALSQEARMDVYALDNAKEAIQLACRGDTGVKWMVANLADIPLRDGTVDALLNILTPANYHEFARLQSERGILIKIVPGSRYLGQIRELAAGQLRSASYQDEVTRSYFESHMRLLAEKELCYTRPVTPEQAEAFLRMTPMTFGVDLHSIHAARLREVTIHLHLLIGRRLTEKASGSSGTVKIAKT